MKHRFSLTTITALFPVVSSFALQNQYLVQEIGIECKPRETYLSKDTGFTGFVLGDFVNGVFSAVFAFAISTTGLWNVDCISASLEKQGAKKNTHD